MNIHPFIFPPFFLFKKKKKEQKMLYSPQHERMMNISISISISTTRLNQQLHLHHQGRLISIVNSK